MKYTFAICYLLLALSCTKETYIEGLSPVIKTFSINKPMPIKDGTTSICTLKIEGKSFVINFLMSRYRASTADMYYGFAAGDSVIFVNVMTELSLEIKGGSIKRYSKGELINTTGTYGSEKLPFFAAIKKSPHTGAYQNPIGSTGKNPLDFNINKDGYVAFKVLINSGPVVYGWIHLTTSDQKVTITKYAYQALGNINAGQE
jgi:hypothetical protein